MCPEWYLCHLCMTKFFAPVVVGLRFVCMSNRYCISVNLDGLRIAFFGEQPVSFCLQFNYFF